jgi:hypothetical protein
VLSTCCHHTCQGCGEGDKKFYTKRQFEQATQALKLLYSLGYPSVNDMKAIIWMNAMRNNPITTEDVNIAKKIFGPDVTTLKGKTTHCTPVPIIEDRIEITRELITPQYSVTLCLDGMKVNSISFLTTILKNLMYQTAQYIQHSLASIYPKCLQHVLQIYTLGGFCITTIHCDNEFCPLMDPLALELWNSSELCKSARACPGSRAQQSSHQEGTSPYDLPPPTI